MLEGPLPPFARIDSSVCAICGHLLAWTATWMQPTSTGCCFCRLLPPAGPTAPGACTADEAAAPRGAVRPADRDAAAEPSAAHPSPRGDAAAADASGSSASRDPPRSALPVATGAGADPPPGATGAGGLYLGGARGCARPVANQVALCRLGRHAVALQPGPTRAVPSPTRRWPGACGTRKPGRPLGPSPIS